MMETRRSLGDVCDFIVDCLHTTAPVQDEGFPIVRTPNVGRGRLKLDDAYRVSRHVYEQRTRRAIPRAGDLILAREAPAGNVAVVKNGQQVCLGQRTVHLRPDISQVDPDFLCYLLLTPSQQSALLAGETGATSKHVNMKDIRRLPLDALPALDAQRRVGALLATYDDLIENNRRRIRLLERAARMLYDEWFVRLRFPGHERTSTARNVPEGWKTKHLSEIASITMGQSPKSIYYNDAGVGLPFHQGVTNFGERFPSHRTYCTVHNRLAIPGDVLFSVRAPVGRINVARDKIVIGRGIAAVRSNRNQQNFLFYALKSHFFKEDMIGGGTIFSAVAKKDLHRVELIQPEDEIVDLFSEFVVPIDRQITSLQRTIDKLGFARDTILPRLMNGEIECL